MTSSPPAGRGESSAASRLKNLATVAVHPPRVRFSHRARIEDTEDEHGCNGERERDHETGEGGRYSLTLSLFWARRGHRERAHVEAHRCFPSEPSWTDF